jgi:hypothetical protein
MNVTDFISELVKHGWHVKLRDKDDFDPQVLQTRYALIPDSYMQFLGNVVYCQNSEENVWFLSEDDFEGKSDSAFAWNEFELQSLECSLGDAQLIAEIKNFWDTHIPILISVKGYYSYLAISTLKNEYGVVVEGSAPEYEEVTKLCDSFEELMEKVLRVLNGEDIPYLSHLFNK